MNCIKCYQEIPEGSKFCPHCGAEQTAAPQQDVNAQNYNAGYQETSGYGSSQQNDAQQNNYQNSYQNNYQNGYQNGNYQTPYQQDQGEPVNWVPYLVLSIISALCCCIPGIVAIVFSAQINSAVTSGNTEEARRAAKNAKIWIIVAFVAGILASIVSFMIGSMFEGAYYYYY